jgi:hypothetical protein
MTGDRKSASTFSKSGNTPASIEYYGFVYLRAGRGDEGTVEERDG